MHLVRVPRMREVAPSPRIHRRAQAAQAPPQAPVPNLIDVSPPEIYDPLTTLTTGDESEHCGMQGVQCYR
jgi:hypothetical protein